MRVEVSKAYNDGNANKSHSENAQTIFQKSKTAIRLDMSVNEALGAIMNEDSPEVTVKTKHLRSADLSVVIAENDCSVFKTFCYLSFTTNLCRFPLRKEHSHSNRYLVQTSRCW